MSHRTVRIRELAEQVRGVTYTKSEAIDTRRPGYVPILRAGNITEHGLTLDDLVYVLNDRVKHKQLLRNNDVLIAASSGSIDVVGKAARVVGDLECGFGAFCKVLRPNEKVNPRYFSHFFRTPDYRRRVSALAAGVNINNLRGEHLDELLISLPSRADQQRIAAILDKADATKTNRRESLVLLDALARSIFLDTFGEPTSNTKDWQRVPLGELAEVGSGITIGRKVGPTPTVDVPYLAVSNVQDRFLRLDRVKKVAATSAEIDRFRLRSGDLVITEGGDPDKLGRGTLWNDELPLCIHQNHIFRVRIVDQSCLHPIFLTHYLASRGARLYFLRSAKQTTGIASINKTQLSQLPVHVPPMAKQNDFAVRVKMVERQITNANAHMSGLDELFAALQDRAFSGRL